LSTKPEDIKGNIVTYISFQKVRDEKKDRDTRPMMDIVINQVECPGTESSMPE
jgi:hypothetical protein